MDPARSDDIILKKQKINVSAGRVPRAESLSARGRDIPLEKQVLAAIGRVAKATGDFHLLTGRIVLRPFPAIDHILHNPIS
jgi:hypothetical protein